MLKRNLVGIFSAFLLASTGIADGGAQLSISTSTPVVVLGQPVILELRLRNDLTRPVTTQRSEEGIRITVTDPAGHPVKTPEALPPGGDYGVFGAEIRPGAEQSLYVAATGLASASIPGEYTVSADLPEPKVTASIRILVKPWDARAFSTWADGLTQGIISHSVPDVLEAAKALASVAGTRSEPYACRLANESEQVMTIAAKKLEEIGSARAADCLIEALPKYRGIHKQFIESALREIAGKTHDADVARRIRLSLDSASK